MVISVTRGGFRQSGGRTVCQGGREGGSEGGEGGREGGREGTLPKPGKQLVHNVTMRV